MKITTRAWTLAAVIVLILLATASVWAGLYYKSLKGQGGLPTSDVMHKVYWRGRLFSRKATGQVPDLSWSELWEMARRPGGFGLERLAQGVTAEGAVDNAYNSEDDYAAGATLFSQRCAMCHGKDGIGNNGPPLNRAGLKHGDSDLAIYKVLRGGIAGTAMRPPDITAAQRWQVIHFLRTLMLHGTSVDVTAKTRLNISVSPERLSAAGSRTDEWLTYSGSYDGHRYTPLAQITPANVSQLKVRWIQQFNTPDPTIEATPIIIDGTMFTTEPPSNVMAIDVKTGDIIWRYERHVESDLSLCCGRQNRGVAILGRRLFGVGLDGWVFCLDANTGRLIWETHVADFKDGYSVTGAPLVVNNSIIIGVGGGDYGIRGFLAAYDPLTGQQQWKFNTVPGPGEPGHETWAGGWQTGGGPTWITGSYDPALDLLYWGVGNPASDFSGDNRMGDNLYTNSVIAMHPATGKLAWYFQFTPHDEHDWDATQTPILTEVMIHGTKRKVLCWANRNGFYYVLDRVTGEFLTGVPFVEQNWNKGLDGKGRPIPIDATVASVAGRLTRPASSGGTNWQNAAIDPKLGLFFVHATEGASVFTKSEHISERDMNEKLFLSSAASVAETPKVVVRALDIATGAKKWEHFTPPLRPDLPYAYSGLLSTGGGLLFGSSGGALFALDSETGREVWHLFVGGDTRAAPISFTIEGKQVIAVSAGRSLYLFGL